MPVLPPGKTANKINPNATSLDVNRRNWQRATQGGLTPFISVTAPLTNVGGSIGFSFETSVFSVLGGVFSFTLLTTKGDLATYSTHPVRLPVGTDGQLLTADSAQPEGISWLDMVIPTLQQVADAGNVSTTVLQAPLNYATGETLTDAAGLLYYPSGVILADSTLLYSPDGVTVLANNSGTVQAGVTFTTDPTFGTYVTLGIIGGGSTPAAEFFVGSTIVLVAGFDATIGPSGRALFYSQAATLGLNISTLGVVGLGPDTGDGSTNPLQVFASDGHVEIANKLNLPGLPTSPAGLSPGDVWNNGGVLNIV